MTPTRQKAKPVFDPSALDQDLDDLWPAPKTHQTPQPVAPPSAPAAPSTPHRTPTPPPPATTTSPAQPASPATPSPTAVPPTAVLLTTPAAQPTNHTGDAQQPNKARIRPPEVLLSSEVYDELYRVQLAEKKVRRGLARTMGAIVLDAIEAHATRLATTWANQQDAVGEGQLFERPSSNAVPRRRRHATAPRTVVLSGVTAANGQRLDNLVLAWGAGTRSALVEQALRYEFDLLPHR